MPQITWAEVKYSGQRFLAGLIGVCDTISASGLMLFSAHVLLANADGITGEVNSGLSDAVALSTAAMSCLTRFPAVWSLFVPIESRVPLDPAESDRLLDSNEPARTNQCGRTAIFCSYFSALFVGAGLVLVQALGSETALSAIGMKKGSALYGLSYVGGTGSAIAYFSFVFMGGLANNKIMIGECSGRRISEERVFSNNWRYILATLSVSFLGAFANSTFDFFSTSAGLKNSFPSLPTEVVDVLAGMVASALFYIVFLSYVLDTHKVFSGSFAKTLPNFRNLTPGRYALLGLGGLLYLFNKLSIGYILYSSAKSVMTNKWSIPWAYSRVLAAFPAASATFIQSVYEFGPTFKNLLHMSQTQGSCASINCARLFGSRGYVSQTSDSSEATPVLPAARGSITLTTSS